MGSVAPNVDAHGHSPGRHGPALLDYKRRALLMTGASIGCEASPMAGLFRVLTSLIRSTTSMPSVTRPNTQ